ncbi:DUF3999 family protein [Rugamonas sp. CCM 8940]|nr:DUF3999 family protein [Rugamonas sp. CCM 8940]
MAALALQTALALPALAAATPGAVSDTPQDYAWALPLSAKTGQGVLQLRLPADVYLHARSPQLDDLRVFDAHGAALPFTLQAARGKRQTSHRSLPLKIFPLLSSTGKTQQLDLDVRTATDGRLLSVRVRPEAAAGVSAAAGAVAQLSALILDLGPPAPADAAPLIDALRFTLPAGLREYNAQVWLDTSDDLKHWDPAGATELNWLVSQDAQTLANDKLEFAPRRFRYARLRWHGGTPLPFAGVVAEQLLQSEAPPYRDQLRLQPAPGRQADELVYATPPAVSASQVGLDFGAQTVVLPVALGSYRELPPRQLGQAGGWLFEPVASATFYRLVQAGQVRASGELDVAPRHTLQWAARGKGIAGLKPVLRLAWEPATLIFLASGAPPYTLAVGRDKAAAAARELGQVAPGFSSAELQTLETASAGPAQQRQAGAGAAADDAVAQAGAAARRRLWVLWGVLLLGVAVLGLMVWRLLKPATTKKEEAGANAEGHAGR